MTLKMASSSLYTLLKKYTAHKNITPVTKVKGIALLINFFNPDLKDLSSSKIKVIVCRIE